MVTDALKTGLTATILRPKKLQAARSAATQNVAQSNPLIVYWKRGGVMVTAALTLP